MALVISEATKSQAKREMSRMDACTALLNQALGTSAASRGAIADQLHTLASECELQNTAEEIEADSARVRDPHTSGDEYSLALEHMVNQREGLASIAEPLPEETKTLLQRLATSAVGTAVIATGAFTSGATGINADAIQAAEDKYAGGGDKLLLDKARTAGQKWRLGLGIGLAVALVAALALVALKYGPSVKA